MNKTFLLSFIAITLLSFTLSSKVVEIDTNKEIEDSIDMRHPIKYYVFKTEKADGMVKDILITSTVPSSKKTIPFMLASTSPLPNHDKSTQWICGHLGKECKIPKEFSKRADKIYLAIGGKESTYTFKVTFTEEEKKDLSSMRNLEQTRLLQNGTTIQEPSIGNPLVVDKTDKVRGAGVAALSLGFIFVFTVIISSYIMMAIFVNSKFIAQPLKLGKIEA